MSLKKVALEALKTKFEGIDEKVLSRIAIKLAKTATDEEDIKTKVEEMTLQGVIDAYTDSRVTDASDKAVKTYEEKHGLKDGKKLRKKRVKVEDDDIDDDDDDDTIDDDAPAYAKALMKSISALSSEVSALKEGKRADTRKAAVDKLLEKAPEALKKQIQREFSRATFKDDEDFDAWVEEIKPDIKEASDKNEAEGNAGSKPKGGGGEPNNVNPYVQARIDARKAETVSPAIQGLPQNN